MSTGPTRLKDSGRLAGGSRLTFSFDGREMTGLAGDTLASALLANGTRLVARSFKYHRPRGIFAAGVDEPNALVTLHRAGRHQPNMQATTVELREGLQARSQNCWPSLRRDALAINDRFSRFLTAGFYYKTFMGPTRKSWMFYERFIRSAAGMGAAPDRADPDTYEKRHGFCDVLVIGGGPAGLAAAEAAAAAGARVVLAEQDPVLGGQLLNEPAGGAGDRWLAERVAALRAAENVRILTRCTVFGAYDHGGFGMVERLDDGTAAPADGRPRERMWTLRAGRCVLAAGAIERPVVLGGNDLPGVMLSGAARRYLNHFGVLAGRDVTVFTSNDGAYATAIDLARAGARVCLLDARPAGPEALGALAREAGVEVRPGTAVRAARGRGRVERVEIGAFDHETARIIGAGEVRPCDLLCVSGGWTSSLHILGQRGVHPLYDDESADLRVAAPPDGFDLAGAANGVRGTDACITDGHDAGRRAAADTGHDGAAPLPQPAGLRDDAERPCLPLWEVRDAAGRSAKKAFVDLQNDVTADDVALAHREGYVSVEHLKRYTTLGMATDQGKTANVIALALMAELRGQPIAEVGTTTFRPPFTPVSIGALAGIEIGPHITSRRQTPMRAWHDRQGAVFLEAGPWDRAWHYPKAGEDVNAAYPREALALREGVGLIDVSTLGKIDVQGPDAAELLNRVYVNGWKKLAVGRARYGVMLRDDGMVFDDGTTTRLAENHYFMTTTTAGAGQVMSHLEFLLQTAWRDLRVAVTSATDQWAALAVSGPKSRALLAGMETDIDFSREALPFMGATSGHLAGLPVRVLRITFTGELGFEIYTPAGHGEELIEKVHAAGQAHGVSLCGTEALGLLRIEMGHVAGTEITGRTTLDDLGLGRMGSTKKSHVGKVMARRPALMRDDRQQFVGLRPVERGAVIRGGSLLMAADGPMTGHGLGVVTVAARSELLGGYLGLGLLSGGRARIGSTVVIFDAIDDTRIEAEVTAPQFHDPEGEKARA